MLYWWFHFENETPIHCLFTQWEWTYILDFGPWRWSALSMGYMDKRGIQECKDNFIFQNRTERATVFGWDLQILDLFCGGCPEASDHGPWPLSTSPWKFVGGGLASSQRHPIASLPFIHSGPPYVRAGVVGVWMDDKSNSHPLGDGYITIEKDEERKLESWRFGQKQGTLWTELHLVGGKFESRNDHSFRIRPQSIVLISISLALGQWPFDAMRREILLYGAIFNEVMMEGGREGGGRERLE